MKINQFNKSLQITKAEEDSTTASEKAKNTQPGIHDSFETGTPTPPANQSGGSAPAPPMKVEPASEKILNQQLITARLAEPGIKSPGSNPEKEPAVKKDPGIAPGEAETTFRTDAFGGNARSNREKMIAGMSDFLAGFGSNSSGQSSSTSPGGPNARPGGLPNATNVNNAMTGGPTGPQNPEESMNQKFEQHSGMASLRSKEAAVSEMISGFTPDTSESDHSGQGKEGVMQKKNDGGVGYGATYDEEEGLKGGSKKAAENNPGMDKATKVTLVAGGSGSAREYALLSSQDDFNPKDYTRYNGTRVQTGKDGTEVETAPDGTKTVTTPDGTKTTVKPDGSTITVKPDGTKEETQPLVSQDVDQENYIDPGAERAKKMMDQLLNMVGVQTTHSGPPKIQGDVDPHPDAEGTPESGELTPLQQMGALGMFGQPPSQEQVGPMKHGQGNNPNLGGGDVDFEDGHGYMGPELTENPEDVDVTIGNELKPPVGQTNEDEEDDENEAKKTKTKRRI